MTMALGAIVPWYLTNDPLWSVVLITVTDIVAYYPTLRKSWLKPYEENLTTYALGSIEYALTMPAMLTINMTTVLYPLSIIGANLILIGMVLHRRSVPAKAA